MINLRCFLGIHKWEPLQYRVLHAHSDFIKTGFSVIGEHLLHRQFCYRCGKVRNIRLAPDENQVYFIDNDELKKRQKKLSEKQENSYE